jgi:hypothetical protein
MIDREALVSLLPYYRHAGADSRCDERPPGRALRAEPILEFAVVLALVFAYPVVTRKLGYAPEAWQ